MHPDWPIVCFAVQRIHLACKLGQAGDLVGDPDVVSHLSTTSLNLFQQVAELANLAASRDNTSDPAAEGQQLGSFRQLLAGDASSPPATPARGSASGLQSSASAHSMVNCP